MKRVLLDVTPYLSDKMFKEARVVPSGADEVVKLQVQEGFLTCGSDRLGVCSRFSQEHS